jgi:hypothetical protein
MKKYSLIVYLFYLITSLQAEEFNHPLLVISIPKSGTHLVARVLELFLEKQFTYVSDLKSLESAYTSTPNSFFCAHFPFYQDIEDFLLAHNFKVFFVVRHPGDVLVSFAHWVHSYYSSKITLSEMITYLMVNGSLIYSSFSPFKKLLWGVGDYYNHFLPWYTKPYVCSLKFENLVGVQGGGTARLQQQEILKIVNYLEREITDEQFNYLINNLFGGTMTFREGVIGAWKRVFTPAQKEYFINNNEIKKVLDELAYSF